MSFKPMRSVAPDEKFPVRFPMLGSYKYDGIRLCRYDGKLVTKSGKQLPNKAVRNWILAHIPEGIDFEVIVGPPNLETTYNTTYRGVMSIEGEPDFTLYCFDICEAEGAAGGFAHERYVNMVNRLKPVMQAWPGRVVPVDQKWLHSQAELDAFYSEALEAGYEGIVVKDPSGFYKWGKCTAKEGIQFKIKPEVDAEAMVVGFYEAEENQNEAFKNELGETKRSTHQENKVGKGTLGGFIAKDLATGRDIRVPCGKMKHAERQHVWNNQAQYVNEIFTYRAMGYGELNLPRQPRWYRWRHVVDVEASGK